MVERVLAVGVAQAICTGAVEPVMEVPADIRCSDDCLCILGSSHNLPEPLRSESNTEHFHGVVVDTEEVRRWETPEVVHVGIDLADHARPIHSQALGLLDTTLLLLRMFER